MKGSIGRVTVYDFLSKTKFQLNDLNATLETDLNETDRSEIEELRAEVTELLEITKGFFITLFILLNLLKFQFILILFQINY